MYLKDKKNRIGFGERRATSPKWRRITSLMLRYF